MKKRYVIEFVESERGWGQDYWTEDFDSYEEAVKRYNECNARNTESVAPDYYIQANKMLDWHDGGKVIHTERIIK